MGNEAARNKHSERLSRSLGYQFNDTALFEEALSHRSIGSTNYERLEFLGDSLLGFVIADELFKQHPSLDEGSLSRLRASLVNGTVLASIAREIDVGQNLRLGQGELKSGGFNRDSILADVVESLIGAVYLDGGLEPCREMVLRLFEQRLIDLPTANELKDPKTRLQEALQGAGIEPPVYSLIESTGKAHEKEFTVSCVVSALELTTTALGTSRRKAEQHAASMMLVESPILKLKD